MDASRAILSHHRHAEARRVVLLVDRFDTSRCSRARDVEAASRRTAAMLSIGMAARHRVIAREAPFVFKAGSLRWPPTILHWLARADVCLVEASSNTSHWASCFGANGDGSTYT